MAYKHLNTLRSERLGHEVLSPRDARWFFEDGARRWRKPHQGRRVASNGLDTDSMDFRGVRALLHVTSSPPKEYYGGHRLPIDPDVIKTHYDLGLAAIRNAGTLPLDDRFEAGYNRWANAVIKDEARKVEESKNSSMPHQVA